MINITAFSVAYGAHRKTCNKLQYRFVSWSTLAFSSEEAVGKGLVRCKQEFPKLDGWEGHDVSVCQVDQK